MNQEYKVQTGLRIPEQRYNELREISMRSGASLNAVILQLVDVGLRAINLGTLEVRRAATRTP